MTDEEFLNRVSKLSLEDLTKYMASHKSIWDLPKEEQEKRMWAYATHGYAEYLRRKERERQMQLLSLFAVPDDDTFWI